MKLGELFVVLPEDAIGLALRYKKNFKRLQLSEDINEKRGEVEEEGEEELRVTRAVNKMNLYFSNMLYDLQRCIYRT